MARAVSTVVDVTVCLLLVGAAVATLATAVPPSETADRHDSPGADTTAARIATVTTGVPTGDGRVKHGPLATHLAAAAVADARLGNETVLETSYPGAVRNETAELTGRRVSITARWEPYPEAPVAGRLAVGSEPPPSADVGVRTLTVDSGIDRPGRAESFEALARSLASAYVRWLFPPDRTHVRLGDARTAPGTAARYRAVGETLGVDVAAPLADAEVRRGNERVADSLAERFEADLRERYATPEGAASNVTVDEVEIVVRGWQP